MGNRVEKMQETKANVKAAAKSMPTAASLPAPGACGMTHRQAPSGLANVASQAMERRKKLLKYLRRSNGDSYGEVIYRLGLKDRSFVEDKYVKSNKK